MTRITLEVDNAHLSTLLLFLKTFSSAMEQQQFPHIIHFYKATLVPERSVVPY